MPKNLRLVDLSPARQFLLRLCQSTNYGVIAGFLIDDREPILDAESLVLADLKLDSKDSCRGELDTPDFLLCAEIIRLFDLFDAVQTAKVSKLEIRAGIPRRVVIERKVSDLQCHSEELGAISPAARQAGSKGPVRRPMIETERKTAADEVAGHGRDARGGQGPDKTPSRREYPETARVGDCFGS